MEQPRYYELDNDKQTYCVHFANKHGLSIDRIKDIFSEFGKVDCVRKAGDDHGFRFVKYCCEDDAKRCVEALKSHRLIRLLPKRPKQRNDENNGPQYQNDSKSKQELRRPWGLKSTENNGKFDNFQNNDNGPSNNEGNFIESQHSPETQNPVMYESCNSLFKTKIEKSENIVEEEKKKESCNVTENAPMVTAKTSLSGNIGNDAQSGANINESSVLTLKEPKIAEKSLIPPPNNLTIINEALEIPGLISSKSSIATSSNLALPAISLDNIPEEIPELVNVFSVAEKKNSDEGMTNGGAPLMKKIINKDEIYSAEEIYVANVPTDLGAGYICHLFEKHEPLWIDSIKYVQSTAIRFCIVFFRSAEQANACEAQFDGHQLGGKNLIILRPQTLRDIAAKS